MRSKYLSGILVLELIGILALTGCGGSPAIPAPAVATAMLPTIAVPATTIPTTAVLATAVPTIPPTNVPATLTTTPSPAQPLASDAEINSRFDKLFSTLQNSGTFSGVVFVAHNGKVIFEKGIGTAKLKPFPPLTSASKFRIASDTKQFTAAAILKLQAQGKLNVKDSICKYLKPCPDGWDKVTLHHLLTHTSGINGLDLKDWDKPHTAAELVAQIEKLPLKFEPGAQFLYGNDGYILLAALIEQLSGKTYEAFLRESFFVPLKMNDTGIAVDDTLLAGYQLPEDVSNLVGGGDIYSTVQDLYRWTQALDAWQRDPASEYQPMFQPQVTSDIPGWKYGYALDVANEKGHLYVGHPGGLAQSYGSLVARYPDDGLTVIELSNNGYALDEYVLATMLFGAK